ncbi:MAG: DegT/DnrJ/EryC1/StrS family aminotransferase, partial [Spirochaetaceae bacterium]|nr:DegT/DnrJ/EryC1/StrS family aminotransferase [Spirochaetaceae bacterium]
MSDKKSTDFRYNTGSVEVPWAAVGENYYADDILEFVRFLIQGDGTDYNSALEKTRDAITTLAKLGNPPGKLSLGSKVQEIEHKIDKFLGIRNSTLITNATAGFEIAGKYAGLEEGDEVIVPAITFIATMSYPLSVGAKVVFADVDPLTLNMDPVDVERKITSRTKLIIPVHLGGWPVDMDPIMVLAKKHDIVVLEDAAHAFGSEYKGRKIGTIGDFASFSFHEVKNITSFGEGGIVTSTLPFSDELKKARFLGFDITKKVKNWLYDVTAVKGKYGFFAPGNSSSTEIQALGLIQQFDRIEGIIKERRENAELLTEEFRRNPAIIPQRLDTDDIKSTYHLYL